MTKHRLWAAAVSLAVFAAALVATPGANAQLDEITIDPGPWRGIVTFGGSVAGTNATWSATPSILPVEFMVNEKGEVTSGTMTVGIGWTQTGSGVTSKHTQGGTLALSGTVQRLVAEGSLAWATTEVVAGADDVDEVEGTEPVTVTWVFEATESTCGLLTGSLAEASGTSLMTSAIDSSTLSAESRIWPDRADIDVEGITDDAMFLNEQVHLALADPTTSVTLLFTLVSAAEQLRERLAVLEFCDLLPGGFLPVEGELGWLASLIQDLLFRALETPEKFDSRALIEMLNIGVRGGALAFGAEALQLYEQFGAALLAELDEAIADGDLDEIAEIALTAGQYDYTDLYNKAVAAYEELN